MVTFQKAYHPDLRKMNQLFFLSVIMAVLSFSLQAQENVVVQQGDLEFEFLKDEIHLEKAASFFNVLRLKNNSEDTFEGTLTFSIPQNWLIFGEKNLAVRLQPGQEILHPLRISVPPGIIGGISYTLSAEIRSGDYYDYRTSYISVESVSKWSMYVSPGILYLYETNPSESFEVRIINEGNMQELVKLDFDVGGLLQMKQADGGGTAMFVDLKAFQDTVLSFSLERNPSVGYAEKRALENNFRAHSVYIKASTKDYQAQSSVRVEKLEAGKSENRNLQNAPLNVDIGINNILSSQVPAFSVNVNGQILYPDDQSLRYSVGFNHIYPNTQRMQDFDVFRELRYSLRYADNRTSVEMADRMGIGQIHTLTGNGVRASHVLNDKHRFFFNGAFNPINGNIGSFVGYSSSIKGIGFNTGATVETYTDNSASHYSFNLGTNFRIFKKSRIGINTVTSLDRFARNLFIQEDTATIGLGYRAYYQYRGERFQLRVDNLNTNWSYLRNSGINRINGRAIYRLNEASRLEAVYYRHSYDATKYPARFTYPSNQNVNDNAQIIYSITRGNRIYTIGPYLNYLFRQYHNNASEYTSAFTNIQPGMYSAVTFRLGMMRSISPYVRLRGMHVDYSSDDPAFIPYRSGTMFQSTIGLSYYDQSFKLNAYYSSGEASDVYRSVVVETEPEVNQSVNIRPYYERFFADEKIRLSTYLNYSYYMPSLRENIIFNVTSDIYMERGVRLFASANLFRMSRTDEELGRITNRDVNLLLGIRKAFDIQQPRLKYYDVLLVGFNDRNGNGIKDPEEMPISNVVVKISRDPDKNADKNAVFMEETFVTDYNGEIFYMDMPEGAYDLGITALSSLDNLFFLHGNSQVMEVHEDMTYYLPLVESYRVRGKIIVDRDPNSNEGNINLDGIRVTAEGSNGESYSTLSDAFGNYVINLPRATDYTISIYNVFGEQFVLEQGRYQVQFTQNRTVQVDFRFREKRRSLQFREGEQFFDFNLDNRNQIP